MKGRKEWESSLAGVGAGGGVLRAPGSRPLMHHLPRPQKGEWKIGLKTGVSAACMLGRTGEESEVRRKGRQGEKRAYR